LCTICVHFYFNLLDHFTRLHESKFNGIKIRGDRFPLPIRIFSIPFDSRWPNPLFKCKRKCLRGTFTRVKQKGDLATLIRLLRNSVLIQNKFGKRLFCRNNLSEHSSLQRWRFFEFFEYFFVWAELRKNRMESEIRIGNGKKKTVSPIQNIWKRT